MDHDLAEAAPKRCSLWWLEQKPSSPELPALLDQEGLILSRGELSRAVNDAASFLLQQGIGRADRLAILMAAGPALAASLLAGMAVAAVAPLSPSATHLLVDDHPPDTLLAAASASGVRLLVFNPLTVSTVQGRPGLRPAADDLALLLQTSGTTSRPKVVPLSHGNLLASARAVADALALGPADRSLAAMPLFHIHGIVASLLAPLLAGGSVICCRSAAPATLLGLLSELDRSGQQAPDHRLRLLRSSSSALPPAVLERLEAVFQVPVLEAYGMTEASHQICSNRLPGCGHGRLPGSVGLPAGPEVVVLGAAGRPLPAGERGEVAIRGPGVTAGYEGGDQTGWVEVAGGERWFRTGDEGLFDTQGRLCLTGRLKEMINRGGEKVTPRCVDEALLEHPSVEQAVAFAVPHPTLGEDLAAAVVLRPGAQTTEEALRSHAFMLLPPHAVPSQIVLMQELPRGATGKLQRIGLANRLAAQLQPAEAPASGELEELVSRTFAAVLQQAQPGRNANFFQLGGDSLSGQRAVIALEQELALDLRPTLVFACPTVRTLAAHLDGLLHQALATAEESADCQLVAQAHRKQTREA
jgi:acyl-CoA synthetase (AMP-forming)/AMP-acid ligase II/acyl carrier protein